MYTNIDHETYGFWGHETRLQTLFLRTRKTRNPHIPGKFPALNPQIPGKKSLVDSGRVWVLDKFLYVLCVEDPGATASQRRKLTGLVQVFVRENRISRTQFGFQIARSTGVQGTLGR